MDGLRSAARLLFPLPQPVEVEQNAHRLLGVLARREPGPAVAVHFAGTEPVADLVLAGLLGHRPRAFGILPDGSRENAPGMTFEVLGPAERLLKCRQSHRPVPFGLRKMNQQSERRNE